MIQFLTDLLSDMFEPRLEPFSQEDLRSTRDYLTRTNRTGVERPRLPFSTLTRFGEYTVGVTIVAVKEGRYVLLPQQTGDIIPDQKKVAVFDQEPPEQVMAASV
jgi:hypothetical protein